jgi:methylphosphotriester-DNA--protein-cysteine methyltransferase
VIFISIKEIFEPGYCHPWNETVRRDRRLRPKRNFYLLSVPNIENGFPKRQSPPKKGLAGRSITVIHAYTVAHLFQFCIIRRAQVSPGQQDEQYGEQEIIYSTTIHAYRHNARIKKATLLLTTTQQTPEAIAISCGFETEAGFSHTFKKELGLSPAAYRMQENTKPKSL